MKLSKQAITELKEALKIDLGQNVNNLSETELQELGVFLLVIDTTYLKILAQTQQ